MRKMIARRVVVGCLSILISSGASGLSVSADGPWLQALEAEEHFEVVSVVSHVDSLSLARTNLMSEFPLKVTMVGFTGSKPKEWTNLKRVKLLHNYVVNLPPDKIVFVLDFFDVAWLACRQDLVKEFKSFGRPLVFGAELFPYPLVNGTLRRMGGYPVLPGAYDQDLDILSGWVRLHGHRRFQEYRYLNAGGFAGFAWAIHRATRRLLVNNFKNPYVFHTPLARTEAERRKLQVGVSDQVAWHAYLWKHPQEIALDYGARLFLNTAGFKLRDFELRDGRIWGNAFGREVCFAHGNGGFNVAWALLECQRAGRDPSTITNMTIFTVIHEENSSIELEERVL